MNNTLFPREMVFDKTLNKGQLELLKSQYQKYLGIKRQELDNNQYRLYLDDDKRIYFPKGTLIYGIEAKFTVLEKISKEGILAPEFNGTEKEDKYFYSVVMKKVINDSFLSCLGKNFLLEKKLPFIKYSNNIAFVINPTSRIGGLLYYDLLDSKFDNRVETRNIIEVAEKKDENEAALLVGVPSNCISGIILGDKIVLDNKLINSIERMFPNSYIITSKGMVIKDRSNIIVVEDFDKLALNSAQKDIKIQLMIAENKKLNEENKKLKDNLFNMIEAIKDNTTYYNQAKIYKKMGYNLPQKLLNKLTPKEIKSLNK
ncbi:MAG: hypothetical protein ACI31S_04140 [Bacilli bacterium]